MKEIIEKNRTEINEIYNSKGREKKFERCELGFGKDIYIKRNNEWMIDLYKYQQCQQYQPRKKKKWQYTKD